MTRSLNLDSMFVPVQAPEIRYKLFQFPGGEWHIKLSQSVDYSQISKVIITHRVRTLDDLMKVAIAKDALKRELYPMTSIDLVMPYIPYARQDRICEPGESFTLKVFADLLNSLKFDSVHVVDPHSDVAPALINNCVISNNHNYIWHMMKDIDESCHLIIPDAGAGKKALKIAKEYSFFSVVKCDKARNTVTGELSGFEVYTPSLHNKPCVIVDDICDGGGTFNGLAEVLKKHGAGLLYLFVTHGIFSKGFEDLRRHFDHVYCTNSFKTMANSDFLTQYPITL